MTDDNNKSKLVHGLAVKCSDYAIDTFVPSFEFEDEKGTYTKNRITIPLKVEGNRILKGLKIRCYTSGIKSFLLLVWFNNKSLRLGCGTFTKDVYGIKEVEEYLTPIVKACTNKDGHWEIDPKVYLKEEKIKEETKQKIKSTNKMIELICEDNFPKTKVD